MTRPRLVLRRSAARGAETPSRIRAGPLEMDLQARTACIDGQYEPLRLTPREWDLLAALAGAQGRVVTHKQLLSAVWRPAHAEDAQYLRVYVGYMRQKLGSAASLLRTEPGIGYRFDGSE